MHYIPVTSPLSQTPQARAGRQYRQRIRQRNEMQLNLLIDRDLYERRIGILAAHYGMSKRELIISILSEYVAKTETEIADRNKS